MANREYEIWDKKGREEKLWIQLRRFALSYKKAFETLINKEVEEGSLGYNYGEEDILPPLHLFHHYIELSLKSLLEKAGMVIKCHDLPTLLVKVEKEYPDFKLSKLPRKLITDNDIINKNRLLLDLEGFRYPTTNKGERIWITESGLGSYINLGGVHISSKRLMLEVDEYFQKIGFR